MKIIRSIEVIRRMRIMGSMKNIQRMGILICFMASIFVVSCANTQNAALEEGSQVQLRNIQTRAFHTKNKKKMLIAVVGALQDLGFVISKADYDVGTVSAEKLDGYNLKITVTVRKKGKSQILVRASAQYNTRMVSDPKPYRDFFTSLSKSIFLEAHSVH